MKKQYKYSVGQKVQYFVTSPDKPWFTATIKEISKEKGTRPYILQKENGEIQYANEQNLTAV